MPSPSANLPTVTDFSTADSRRRLDVRFDGAGLQLAGHLYVSKAAAHAVEWLDRHVDR